MSDTTLNLILKKLEAMENDMSELKEQLGKNEMLELKEQLVENTQITKAIHHRQSESDAKLEGISLDFAKLHGEVVSTKESIAELVEDQKSINELMGEHEVAIRSLRRKPV